MYCRIRLTEALARLDTLKMQPENDQPFTIVVATGIARQRY